MELIKTHQVNFTRKRSLRTFKKEWRWNIKASNGKTIASSSEGYINRIDCVYNAKSTAESIMEHFAQ